MKKIILLLIIILINVRVEAKTYYSNYSDYKRVDNLMEETDLIKIKQEDKYLLYKEKIIEKYYPSYEIVDDMIKTDQTKLVTSEWLNSKPQEFNGRKIIEQEFFEYKDIKKVKHINLSNLSYLSDDFGIYRLQIFDKDTLINYDIDCLNCEKKDLNKIKNKDSNDVFIFNKGDEIFLELDENIAIQNIKIAFVLYSEENKTINASINLLGEENKEIYLTYKLNKLMNINLGNKYVYNLNINSFALKNPIYEILLVIEEQNVSKFATVNKTLKYQTEDLYIKYYTIEKEYSNDYFLNEMEGFKLDLNTKKTFYYIKKREKLEIIDRLIIDNYQTKLEDLVLYDSTNKIKITSNINYFKNGEYDISFLLPTKTIKTKVIVDIKDNYIKALKIMNKELKNLEKVNNELFITSNKLNAQLKEVLEYSDKKLKDANETLIKYQHENKELKKDKAVFSEEKSSKFEFKKFFVILIVLFLLFILIFLRKKSIQNNN